MQKPKVSRYSFRKKHEASFFAFDAVGENQSQEEYSYAKATLEDGAEIYIASPGALIGAKAYEVAKLRAQRPPRANSNTIQFQKLDTPEKIEAWNQEAAERFARSIEKRRKDLVTMIAGFSKVMSREQIIEAAKTALCIVLKATPKTMKTAKAVCL